jgi:hypothetical protein
MELAAHQGSGGSLCSPAAIRDRAPQLIADRYLYFTSIRTYAAPKVIDYGPSAF